MTALMAGGVSADHCSVLTCSRKAQALMAAAIAIQQAEKDRVRNTMEMSLWELWDCLSLPALLMEPSSKQSPVNGDSFAHKTLSARSAEVRSPAGVRKALLPGQISGWLQEGQGWILNPEPAKGLCAVSHPLLTPSTSTSWKTKARA